MKNLTNLDLAVAEGIPSPGIPVDQGITYTANYRSFMSHVDPNPNYIRAFNIPMEDITSLADFTKCPSVRAYLGMSDPTDPSTLKLVLVPVDVNNLDILTIDVPGISGGDETQSSVYDLTSPCPSICDVQSPLFQD